MDAVRVKNLCESYFHIEKPKSLGSGLVLGAKIASYVSGIIPLLAGIALGMAKMRLWYLERKIRVLHPEKGDCSLA